MHPDTDSKSAKDPFRGLKWRWHWVNKARMFCCTNTKLWICILIYIYCVYHNMFHHIHLYIIHEKHVTFFISTTSPKWPFFSADAFGSPTRGIPGSTLLAISIFLGWIDTWVTKNYYTFRQEMLKVGNSLSRMGKASTPKYLRELQILVRLEIDESSGHPRFQLQQYRL